LFGSEAALSGHYLVGVAKPWPPAAPLRQSYLDRGPLRTINPLGGYGKDYIGFYAATQVLRASSTGALIVQSIFTPGVLCSRESLASLNSFA
jgi:hypothetical protein